MSTHLRIISVGILAVFGVSLTVCGWTLAVPAAGAVAVLDLAAILRDRKDRHARD